jgi:hypothetical protein
MAFFDGDLDRSPGALPGGSLVVLGDHAIQVGLQLSFCGGVADFAGSDDQPTVRGLDAVDDLPLDVQVAEEPVEPLGDDGYRIATFDGLDCSLELRPVGEQRPAGDGPDAPKAVDVLVPDVLRKDCQPLQSPPS